MVVQIKWANYAKNSYTFGSQVSFIKDKVVFENPLMSPSFTITSWSSRTNFQGHRTQPDLPLLKRGGHYHIQLEADIYPANSLYVKVTYFNRLGEEIGFEVLKDNTWFFTYPIQAFHYTIELINAGCERLVFDHLKLLERQEDLEEAIDFTDLAVYFPNDSHELNVLFLEPDVLTMHDLPSNLLKELGNLVLVGDKAAAVDCYLSEAFEKRLTDYLWFYHDNDLTAVKFIAYGPTGALAASYYGSRFPSQVYLDQPILEKAYYQKKLNQSRWVNQLLLTPIFDRLTYAGNVHYYCTEPEQEQEDLVLVHHCFERSHRLHNLPFLRPDLD